MCQLCLLNLTNKIKENCDFNYYFNKSNVTPSALDGGHQIILVNWPNYKRIICTYNNNIPVNIPSHPYVLLDRNILCNCDIEAKSNFLLESLAACGDHGKADLEMYFTVNLAFVDYLEELNETVDITIERNWTNYRQILPISLESIQVNSSLLQAPKTLKDFVNQYQESRKMNTQKQKNQNSSIKLFISSFVTDVLVFTAAFLTVVLKFIIIYIIASQPKLKMLVANIALQCVKVIDALNTKNQDKQGHDFGMLKFLMVLNLAIVVLMILVKIKKSKIFQGHFFSNMVKIKLFIADTESYMPLELSKVAGNVHLFKLTGDLLLEHVTLKKNWIWDILEVNWNDGRITLNDKEINLSMSIVIPIVYKLKVRKLFRRKKD